MPPQPLAPAPQLQDIPSEYQSVILNAHNAWREAGADSQGNPNNPDLNKVMMDYKKSIKGEKDTDGNFIQRPKYNPVPGVDVDTPLAPTLSAQAVIQGTEAAKGAVGFSMGVAEALNPFAIPHFVEQVGRAFQEEADPNQGLFGRVSERMQKAGEKTVLPRMDIGQLSAGARTAAETIGGAVMGELPTPSKIASGFNQQLAAQRQFEESNNMPFYQAAGGVSAAAPGLVNIAKNIPTALEAITKLPKGTIKDIISLKNVGQKIKDAAGIAVEEANIGERGRTSLQKAQQLQADLLGDTVPEIGEAIYKRTENVEALLKGKQSARSLLPEVEKLRTHLDDTEQFIGTAVGEFKDFLRNQDAIVVNTRGSVQKLSQIANELKSTTGESFMNSHDLALYDKYKSLLKVPGVERSQMGIPGKQKNTYQMPVSDIMKTLDSLDSDLKPFYDGRVQSNNSRQFLAKLADVRSSLKANLHETFPAYAKADELFVGWKGGSDAIRTKIDSMNAESFVSNLLGANKDEYVKELKNIVDQGKKASEAVKAMKEDATFASTLANTEAATLVKDLKVKAEAIKFPEFKDFLNDIADKIAARKLKTVSDSGQADFPADKIRSLQNRYIERAKTIAEGRARLAVAPIGGAIGGIGGTTLGLLLAKQASEIEKVAAAGAAGLAGAAYGAEKAGNLAAKSAGALAKLSAEKRAKELFTPFKLLEHIKDAKIDNPELKSLASDALFIKKQFGEETAYKFLNSSPVSPQIEKIVSTLGMTSAKGAAATVTPQVQGGNVNYNVDFKEGSTVTPKEKK